MTRLFLIIISILFYITLAGQPVLDWNTLADVTFEDKAEESGNLPYNHATFGPIISLFKNEEVIISGFMIPLDAMGISYALSRNPNASCFFCGGAGPETVVQLQFNTIKRYRTDDRLTFKGKLQMNEKNIHSLTYVLSDAEEL